MSSAFIHDRVAGILHSKLHVAGNLLTESNWDKPLTGDEFRLSSVDLVYLLFEIEKEFKIRIKEQFLRNYGFSTIDSIVSIIQHYT